MSLKFIAGTIAAATLLFASCNQNKKNPAATAVVKSGEKTETLKIAFVDIDSLMKNYKYCVDYTEVLQKKTETIQNTLQSKGLALQKEAADFQSKMQQGSYTREQAESVQTSLQKKQMQLQNLQQSLASEFEKEQDKYNKALRDSVQNLLKEYNKTYGFNYILSKMGDNILLADPKYDITDDVIKALNKRYKPSKELQKLKGKKK